MADGDTVTTQPRSRRKEIEQFVRDLDPTQVVGKCMGSLCLYLVRSSVQSLRVSSYNFTTLQAFVKLPTTYPCGSDCCKTVSQPACEHKYFAARYK